MGDVVLLGAGASKEAGVPMAHEMTERILDRMDGEDRRALRWVCDRLSAGRSELDVEKVFSAIELLGEREQLEVDPFIECWRGEVLRWDRAFYVRLGRRMVAEMRNSIALTYKKVSYLSPLVRWAANPEQGTIATLNYDRAIEVAGTELGLNVHTGIEGWVQTGRWRWPSTPGLRLLKLHGSIDWVWQDDPPGRGRLPSRVVVQTGISVDEARQPTLVFGARGKLRAEGPFLAALTEFERQLKEADRLVVIGYSFRDDHVNQVIRRWTFDGLDRKIVVVDPGFPEHPTADGTRTFQDQLLLHLNSPEDHLGTRLEVRRSGAEAALPMLFPLHP